MSTKLDSLKRHINDGQQRTQQERVLFALVTATAYEMYLTRLQIEEVTGIRTSSVCARINELVALGKVIHYDTVVCAETNKKVHCYRAILAWPALATEIHHPPGAPNA